MFMYLSKKLNKKNRGFTLVELIVVIAIIGILVAIALPQLLGFQDRARTTADKQTAVQIRNALALLHSNGELAFTDDCTYGYATGTNAESDAGITCTDDTKTVQGLVEELTGAGIEVKGTQDITITGKEDGELVVTSPVGTD